MRAVISQALRRLRRDDEGVTLVEYGIAVTLAIVVGTTALGLLANAVDGQLVEAAECIDGTDPACP